MEPVDYILIAVVLLIIGLASYAIYRSKKSGKKCIGCPDSGSCPSSKCGGCTCGRNTDKTEN